MNLTSAKIAVGASTGVISMAGMIVPVAPVLIAVSSAALVRIPFIKSPRILFESTITVLCMLGSFTTVVDHNLSPGIAFWIGVGFGGLGSGIVPLGQKVLGGVLGARLKVALDAFMGVTPTPPPPPV